MNIIEAYPYEDAQQILHLAIARENQDGEFSRAQLVEIAAELGISAQNLQAAELEWRARQGEKQQREEFNLCRRRKLRQHFIRYGIVNTFLVLLNVTTAGTLSWSIPILMIWGLGLTLTTWKTYQIDGDEYETAFQAWRLKKQVGQSISLFLNKCLKFAQS